MEINLYKNEYATITERHYKKLMAFSNLLNVFNGPTGIPLDKINNMSLDLYTWFRKMKIGDRSGGVRVVLVYVSCIIIHSMLQSINQKNNMGPPVRTLQPN